VDHRTLKERITSNHCSIHRGYYIIPRFNYPVLGKLHPDSALHPSPLIGSLISASCSRHINRINACTARPSSAGLYNHASNYNNAKYELKFVVASVYKRLASNPHPIFTSHPMYHRAFLMYFTALVFLVPAAPPVPGKSAQLGQLKERAYIVRTSPPLLPLILLPILLSSFR
jgi:hypothetical protein